MTTADCSSALIGSLLASIGGLDLSVMAALVGHHAWHAETTPHTNRVLACLWPDVPREVPGDRNTTRTCRRTRLWSQASLLPRQSSRT
ncbi:hypothetical protein ACFWZY_28800 [Streptomyces sp. NPDC058992]|uniref:hypothetical protein n=1 Tax=Streptomyces sp. NPDC058992 TaxID=3346688 RepID=UPI0036BE5524